MGASRIWLDIDLDADGKQRGYARLPHSTHESAYGWVPIPIASLKNGTGPRVLLMAGNHGDEYEGQIMLMKLLRTLSHEDVRGQIILLPAANSPAVRVGRRTSPLDGGNLNRSFPGDRDGAPTSMIAHFIETVLLPRVEYVFDFHSAGSSLDYIPFAAICKPKDPARLPAMLQFLEVFAMPVSMVIDAPSGEDRSLIGACGRTGPLHMGSELGGAGTVSKQALRNAEEGLGRLLHHIGVVQRPLTNTHPGESVFMRRLPTKQHVYAHAAGIFEPCVELRDEVNIGDLAGRIHFPLTPWREPEEILFAAGGIVVGKRMPALTEIGDCVFVLARPWTDT